MGREMRDAVKALQQCRKPERPPTKKYTQDPMHREPEAEPPESDVPSSPLRAC